MRPQLHLVDTSTGEIQEGCEGCATLREQLVGAERDVRTWRARCVRLERDQEQDARASDAWEPLSLLFAVWRRECNHPGSKWTAERFWTAEPIYRRYGQEMCERAIAGRAFDHYSRPRRNGTVKRFDDWSRNIFKDSATFEDAANCAPKGWKAP